MEVVMDVISEWGNTSSSGGAVGGLEHCAGQN